MKKLFGLFVIGILSSTAMAELVCLAPSGCAIEIETGDCPTCVETSIVESIVKSEIISSSDNSCPNYFELNHGGKTCEISRDKCDSTKWLCDDTFLGCKEIEKNYNKRFTRNHGKIEC